MDMMKPQSTSPDEQIRAPARVRRLLLGANALLSVLLGAALWLMVNYLGYRHYRRADFSRSGYYRLSEKTRNVLNAVTGEVRVVVFFQPSHDLYEDVRNLLKEYVYACPNLKVEWVDPDRDLARTEELAARYRVKTANVVVFDADGRTKYVSSDDLLEMDLTPLRWGRAPEISAFKGEQAFSSAIYSVTQGRRPIVYFLQGHGEKDPDDYGRVSGYSQIAEKIRQDNIEVRTLNLGKGTRVPEDADALIIGGPRQEFAPAELDALRSFLDRKGNLMLLLDPFTRCGLEPLLASDWGIQFANDVVVDGTRTLTGRELFVPEYPPHPITLPLKGISSVFYLPRSVEAAQSRDAAAGTPSRDRPQVTVLAASSVSGWAETDPSQNPMKFDAGIDRPGPVSIAVAAERGGRAQLDLDIRPARLVVFGDSDFVANGGATVGNVDLFMNALNWLVERESLLAMAPKPVELIRLIMTRRQLQGLFWIVVIGLPALVAAGGLAVWSVRRK